MQAMRITRGKVLPGTWDQFEAELRKAYEEIGHIPGLVSRSLVQNLSDPNEGYTISIWQNSEVMKNYEASDAAKAVIPRISRFFTGDYRTDHGEIRYLDAES